MSEIRIQTLPIRNDGTAEVKIELEPEGAWFPLAPNESCEVRFVQRDDAPLDLELVIEDDMILIWVSVEKQFWKNGERLG